MSYNRVSTYRTVKNTKRGLLKYLFLSLITCGIYSLFFIDSLAKDLNLTCEDDRKHTTGILAYLLLSLITCGIYGFYWWIKSASRIHRYALANGVPVQRGYVTVSGGSFFLWNTLGLLLFGLGPLIAMSKLLRSMNVICKDYNLRATATFAEDVTYRLGL